MQSACFGGTATAFDHPRMYVRQLSGEFSGAIGKRPTWMLEGRITQDAVIEMLNRQSHPPFEYFEYLTKPLTLRILRISPNSG